MQDSSLPSDHHLVKFTNCYLVQPDDGNLTGCAAALWVDRRSGTIAHMSLEDQSVGISFETGAAEDQVYTRAALASAPTIDLEGHILAPGMIDIQINGAYGVDFSHWPGSEADYVRAVERVSASLLETGVTAYLPTIISQTPDMYRQIIPTLHRLAINSKGPKERESCQVIGYHLEGPFLSPAKIGCHPLDNAKTACEGWRSFIQTYSEAIIEITEERELAKLVTIAPEVMGVMDAVPRLIEEGFSVSIGHSEAKTRQAVEAVNLGASLVTHLYNAMPGFHHREPGIIGLLGVAPGSCDLEPTGVTHPSQTVKSAMSTPVTSKRLEKTDRFTIHHSQQAVVQKTDAGLSNQASNGFQRPFWSCIVDGLHVHPFAVNFAYQAHPEGCVLVTDAVSWMDSKLPNGIYPWRSQDHTVTKKGDSVTLTDTDTLAGAAVPLDKCVRNLAQFCGIPLSKAIHCATSNPARCLGGKIARSKGALRVGFDADLTVWNKDTGEMLSTWIAGNQVYGQPKLQRPT